MKNERIITHFQSYTTAKGCVKDLTPHFRGRIAIHTPHSPQNGGQTDKSNAGVQDGEQVEDSAWSTAEMLLAELSEMGGVALGTLAYLYPGMSPILPGGPFTGDMVGQTVGSYMIADMEEEDHPDGGAPAERRDEDRSADRQGERSESVFLTVEVHSEQEAMVAERIIVQHGGKTHRVTTNTPDGDFPSYETLPANPGLESLYAFAQETPSPLPAEYRNLATVGYPLDPISPLTPQGFIDPNIGLGDYNLANPNATVGFPPPPRE